MFKNKKFIYAWPLLALSGTFLLPVLRTALLSWDADMLSPQAFKNTLDAYASAVRTPAAALYCCLAGLALLWSFVRWFKKPCKTTLFWSMFAAWVLCGAPGFCLALLLSFTGFHGA